jgi:hypothetical protein
MVYLPLTASNDNAKAPDEPEPAPEPIPREKPTNHKTPVTKSTPVSHLRKAPGSLLYIAFLLTFASAHHAVPHRAPSERESLPPDLTNTLPYMVRMSLREEIVATGTPPITRYDKVKEHMNCSGFRLATCDVANSCASNHPTRHQEGSRHMYNTIPKTSNESTCTNRPPI